MKFTDGGIMTVYRLLRLGVMGGLVYALGAPAMSDAHAAAGGPGFPKVRRAVPGTVYVVAVGIDNYAATRLSAGVSDARKFARRIEREHCDTVCQEQRVNAVLESEARWQAMPITLRSIATSMGPVPLDRADCGETCRANLRRTLSEGGARWDSMPAPFNSGVDSVVVHLVLDSAATLDAVDKAMSDVVRRATKDDVVVFFFAGMSVYGEAQTGDTTVTLCTIDADCGGPGRNRPTGKGGITANHLRRWMESTSAERQLLVLDACSNETYATELIAGLSPSNPLVAKLSSRNRAVLSSLTLAMESPVLGGVLTHLITSTDELLTDVPFLPPGNERHRFEGDLRRHESRLVADGEKAVLGMFFERDLLRILGRTLAHNALGASRGLTDAGAQTGGSAAATGSAYALVIGTDLYDPSSGWSPLANPVKDARAVARELEERYGYQVTLLENPTADSVYRAVNALQDRTYGENDQVFVFIAGHGYFHERSAAGHLVMRDSRSLREDPGLRSYIDFGGLEGHINGIPAKHVMIALDACFGGAFGRDGGSRGDPPAYRSATRDEMIQQAQRYRSRLYLTSGGKEYVPDGAAGRHSPFASRLLEALRGGGGDDGVLTLLELRTSLQKLAPPVPQPRSGGFGDNEPGSDFVFVAQ